MKIFELGLKVWNLGVDLFCERNAITPVDAHVRNGKTGWLETDGKNATLGLMAGIEVLGPAIPVQRSN